MMPDVNLFSAKLSNIRKKQQLKRLVIRVLLGVVIATAIAMIGLSIYNLILIKTNKKLDQQIRLKSNQIEQLREIESKQVYLLDKLGSFKLILSSQERHQAIAETVFSLLPPGTALKSFTIDESGQIVLSGSVPGFLWLNQLLENVRLSETPLPIIEARMSKLSFSQDGTVVFSLDLLLGGDNNDEG